MIARLLLCLSLGLFAGGGPRAWASSDCEDRLNGPHHDDVLSRLQALPPYLLDYQNLQDSIEKLMASAEQLRAPYQTLKRIEQALKQGKIEPSAAYNMAEALNNYVRKESHQRLDGDTHSEGARRVLEGDRILLNRLQKLQQRAIDQALKEQEDSEESHKQQDSQGPRDEDQYDASLPQTPEVPSRQEDQDHQNQAQPNQNQHDASQPQTPEVPSRQQNQDNQNQDQQKQRQQKKDRFSNEDLAKEMERQLSEQLKRDSKPEDVQNQSEEDFKDLDQKSAEQALDKKLQEQAQESKDGQKSQESETSDKNEECEGKATDKDAQCKTQKEIQERLEQNFEKAKEKAKQEKAQNKGQAKSKKKGQQRGEKGQEKGGQPSQESADQSENKSGEPSEGEDKGQGQEGQNQSQESKSKNHDQVSHSNQAGGRGAGKEGTGAKEFLDTFNQSLKGADTDAPTKDHSKITQEDLHREKLEKKFDRQLKNPPKEELAPPDKRVELELEKLLHTTWSQLLSQYSNSETLLRQLDAFASTCNTLSVTTPGAAHIIKNYAARASTLAEQLRQTEVSYRDLSELALSFSGGVVKDQTLRRARYLERLLSTKEQEIGLRDAEEKTLQLVRAVLKASEKTNDPVTAKTLAEALRDHLLGPLSRRALDQQYPSTNPLDDLNYSAVEEALKGGRLNDLVKFKRMAPFVNILVNDVFKPKFYERYEGPYGPINESDTVIERAEDFEDIPHILREGNPSQLEILRLLAGDMLKNAYREKVIKSDPRKPIPKRASIVLYDISGSMSNGGRDQLRNAIISAFVDQSQTDVARGSGEHTLYLVPFDGQPHEPRRIANLAEAQQVFDDMRARPLGSGGSTSITAALVKAYDMIADHQNNGGDLERANILLLTDGDDSINLNAIEAARAKIDPKVDLALNAITLGDWNQHLCDMVKKYGINGEGEIGKVSHQHIPADEILKLLSPTAAVKDIIDTATDYDIVRNRRVPAVVLDRIRSSVMSIAGSVESEEGMHATRADRWVRHIESLKTTHNNAIYEPQAQLFLELIARNVGKEWATAAKVQAFEDFMDVMEQESELEAPQILSGFKPETREILAKWLR